MEIEYRQVSFGADPEFFFEKNGEIIGAEKVLPHNGIRTFDGKTLVIIDGVQGEFNVPPNTCRQSFSHNLRGCFTRLSEHLTSYPDVRLRFDQTVEVSKEEMETLSPASQQFGCSPSENVYGQDEFLITDASKYYFRSAGGHVHLGLPPSVSERIPQIVRALDVVVGNTCVLLDRSEGNAVRRQTYGKAGEYRTPSYGVEYRTLSNFWLHDYTIMSFVLSMCRFAVMIGAHAEGYEKLMSLVDETAIRKAINNNDFELALDNFNKVKKFLSSITTNFRDKNLPLQGPRLAKFEKVVKKGLGSWFTNDPYSFWLHHDFSVNPGWERFIDSQPDTVATVTVKNVAKLLKDYA